MSLVQWFNNLAKESFNDNVIKKKLKFSKVYQTPYLEFNRPTCQVSKLKAYAN